MRQSTTRATEQSAETTVEVRCTGVVRDAVGGSAFEFAFHGETLREFLIAFFEEYDVAELLIAETDEQAIAHGWAPAPADLPGTWRANPEGERTRPFARVLINGTFNEHLDGFDTVLTDGDRVALMKPFVFCV